MLKISVEMDFMQKDIIVVKGKETADGATTLELVPPNTLLYSRLAETFHRKFHDFGSPVYIRTQILEAGF